MTGRYGSYILVADDDPEDREILQHAFDEIQLGATIRFAEDGVEFFNHIELAGRPSLIILDLNMPRKTGFEVLNEIKTDPGLQVVPVLIYSTARDQQTIRSCYMSGANTFISKPATYQQVLNIAGSIKSYWFGTAALPV